MKKFYLKLCLSFSFVAVFTHTLTEASSFNKDSFFFKQVANLTIDDKLMLCDYVKALYTESSLEFSLHKYLAMTIGITKNIETRSIANRTTKKMIKTVMVLYPKIVHLKYNVDQIKLLASEVERSMVSKSLALQEAVRQLHTFVKKEVMSLFNDKRIQGYDPLATSYFAIKDIIETLQAFCQQHHSTQEEFRSPYEGQIDLTTPGLLDGLYALSRECESRIKKNKHFQKMSVTKLQIKSEILLGYYETIKELCNRDLGVK